MKRLIITFLTFSALIVVASAQPAKTWEGYLADKMCGSNWKGEKGLTKAQKHTKACALEEGCAASGYGLFTGGAFVKFTDASDAKAKVWLEKSTAKNNIYVKVTGTLEGDKIAVADIADATPKGGKSKKMEKGSGGMHGGTASCECCQDGSKASKHGSKHEGCNDCKEKS